MSQFWKILRCLTGEGCMACCDHVLPHPLLHHATNTALFLIMMLNEFFKDSFFKAEDFLAAYYPGYLYAVYAVVIQQFCIFRFWWEMFTQLWFIIIWNKNVLFSSKRIRFHNTNLRHAFHFYVNFHYLRSSNPNQVVTLQCRMKGGERVRCGWSVRYTPDNLLYLCAFAWTKIFGDCQMSVL